MDALFDLLPNTSRATTEVYKIALAGAGAALVVLWGWLGDRTRRPLLVALTVLAAANYARWGEEALVKRVDSYDLIHYYLNAKYFEELGYYDLYPAVILADHENDGPHFDEGKQYLAQDASGHHMEHIAHALERGRLVRDTAFTPERWAGFSHDALYLQREVKGFEGKHWRQMIQDHGFNGTTGWVLIAAPVASLVPVEHVKLLCSLDLLLLAGALALAARAYGAIPMTWTVFWLLVSYSLRWPTVTWSYLRYDYLAALIAAMALLKLERPFIAGLFSGYSGVLRFFPLLWMWGPFCQGIVGLWKKEVKRPLLLLAAGFLVSGIALQGAALVRYGTEPIRVHYENMTDHQTSEQLSSRRIGMALGLAYRGELLPETIDETRKLRVEAQKPLRYGLAAVYLVMVGWGLRRLRADEAFGFGFLPFFLLTTASYYYYAARVTLVMLHAADLGRWRNRIGLAWLVGLECFCNWAETVYPGHRVFLIGTLAWGLSAYALGMGCAFLAESADKDRSPPATP